MAIQSKWNKLAIKQLQDAIAYIEEDSHTNANKVKREILGKIDELILYPERCTPDKYKTNNIDNSFRAFEIHRYRTSYRFIKDEVRIVRIRHTKMNPRYY